MGSFGYWADCSEEGCPFGTNSPLAAKRHEEATGHTVEEEIAAGDELGSN